MQSRETAGTGGTATLGGGAGEASWRGLSQRASKGGRVGALQIRGGRTPLSGWSEKSKTRATQAWGLEKRNKMEAVM